MNNYLLQLLKEIKTIIIPGLGAITLTNETTGEMMFMPYLKYDDGNLAKHISEKEGMDLNDAKNLIAKFVREVTAELDKGHSYDMYQFGSFKKIDGDVAFEQWKTGSATTEKPSEAPQKAEAPSPEPPKPAPVPPMPEPIKAAEPEAPVAEVVPVVQPAPVPEPEKKTEPKAEESKTEASKTEKHREPVAPETEEKPKTAPAVPEKEEPKPSGAETVVAAAILEDAAAQAEPEIKEPAKPAAAPTDKPKAAVVPPKETPNVQPSPKDRAAVADKTKKPDAKKPEQAPKKKRRAPGYILWGFVVLLLGGATYVAVNFETMKKDFPLLADLAGENNDKAVGEKEIKPALQDSTDVSDEMTDEPTDEIPQPTPEEVAPNPLPDEPAAEPEPVKVEKPAKQVTSAPKPTPSPTTTPKKPKPKPKPVSPGSSSGGTIGSPDPSRPFHVIGGSFGSEANARRFARDLIAKGQPSVIVGEFNGMYRVSVASFATKDEALRANEALKGVVPQTWVFRWP